MISQQSDSQVFMTPSSSDRGDSTIMSGGVESQTVGQQYANGFDIKDPVELLFLVDEDIQKGSKNGGVDIHPWQAQFMIDFADERHTKDHPFIAEVNAANGSGKDKYILAACAVWLCMRYTKARVAATNGSGTQLDGQTAFHIENLARKVNKKFGIQIWKINYRYFECNHLDGEHKDDTANNSTIDLFATDEAGKAEGYHPAEAGARFAIFASEAKSIPDTIFTALTRCNGFTHRVDVSSPGNVTGYFYTQWNLAIDRKLLKDVKDCPPTKKLRWKITAYDCPHITENEIELFAQGLLSQGGRNSPTFKSGMLAEFGSGEEMTVIQYGHVNRCKVKKVEWMQEQFNHAGLDLNSGGGAESVLKVRNGNKVIATESFKFQDTTDNEDYCEELFFKHGLDNQTSLIWADCCGAGYPQLCTLRKRGWNNIRFFDSRNASSRPKVYKNIITEMWFEFGLLVQRAEIILDGDELTEVQLVTRYYKIAQNLVHQLLSKLEQKSKGFPSPDRADALVYAFIGYKTPYKPVVVSNEQAPVKRRLIERPVGRFHQKVILSEDRQSTINRRIGIRPDMSYLQEQLDQINRTKQQIVEPNK
jgi:hypothetical protein